MFNETILLKQHTPIIHFQHEQEGATLRATELKPKLDRFLIEEAGNDWSQIDRSWKIGGGIEGQKALDYKIKIIQVGVRADLPKDRRGNYILPMFFGNQGTNKNDSEYKIPVLYQDTDVSSSVTKLEFSSFNPELLTHIKENFSAFICSNNFGMRQSKGYGSFFIHPDDTLHKPIDSFNQHELKFSIKTGNWHEAMAQIELFYKMLRSGINEVRGFEPRINNNRVYNDRSKTVAYCKPVIFLYALKRRGKQWDKKSIKEHFFSVSEYYKRTVSKKEADRIKEKLRYQDDIYELYEKGLTLQQNGIDDDGFCPVHFSQQGGDDLLFRDLFGLSSEQAWRSYGAKLSKEHKASKKTDLIERMKSPLTFKVINNRETKEFDIFLFTKPVPSTVLGECFKIKVKSEKDNRNRPLNQFPEAKELKFPSQFSWDDFFDFLKNDFDLNEAFSVGKNGKEYKILKQIIDQIQDKNNS